MSILVKWCYLLYVSYVFHVTVVLSIKNVFNNIGCVVVSVISSIAVGHEFESWSGRSKDYKIGICCFSAKHAALRRKSKDWLARNQDNVSEWGDMSIRGLLLQWASTLKTNKDCWSSTKKTSSSSHWKLTFSRHNIAEKLLRWR